MATKEYKLSHTAKEIDKKLLKVDGFSTQITALQNVDADLQNQINNKANSSHSHKISDVENLQNALNELENAISSGSGGGSSSDGGGTVTKYDVATQTNNGLMSFEDKVQLDYGGIPIVTASSSNGVTYTATVDGIKELKKGAKITIIPDAVSTSKAITLNVNGLGAKNIRIPSTNTTAGSSDGLVEDWLSFNIPVTIQYNGMYWITTDFRSGSSSTTTNISGVVSVESGGTGATTASEALANLGAAPMYQYSNVDIGTGAELATGTLYFVYE